MVNGCTTAEKTIGIMVTLFFHVRAFPSEFRPVPCCKWRRSSPAMCFNWSWLCLSRIYEHKSVLLSLPFQSVVSHKTPLQTGFYCNLGSTISWASYFSLNLYGAFWWRWSREKPLWHCDFPYFNVIVPTDLLSSLAARFSSMSIVYGGHRRIFFLLWQRDLIQCQ